MQRYYGVSLEEAEAGKYGPLEVAAWVAYAPRGGAIAEWFGGWAAVTAEDEALRRVEYVLVATNAKRKPKQPAPPPSIREKQISDRKKAKERAEKNDALRRMSRIYGD